MRGIFYLTLLFFYIFLQHVVATENIVVYLEYCVGSITVAATFTGICCYFSCCILFAIYKRKFYYLFLYGCTYKNILV